MNTAKDEGGGAFPWDAVMAVGLGVLRLAPAEFWRMTPREFASAIAPLLPARPVPIGRAGLASLMQQFPDEAR